MRFLLPLLATLVLGGPARAQEPDDDGGEQAEIVELPQILDYVEAPYPPHAAAAGIEATVTLLVELDDTGTVLSVEVLDPAGNGFDEAAAEAVRQMRFTPARTAQGPVPVVFEFAYGFTLSAEPPDAPDAPPAPVNFEGSVQEMGTRRALAGVKVVIDGTDLVGETDPEGRFELRGVPVGEHVVRLVSPDHVVLEQGVDIAEGEVTSAKLWLRAEQYRENEVVGRYRREKQEVTRRTLSIQEVKRIPGTFGDPIKVVQTLPGAARSPFGTGLLIIRGSSPEDSGVYVDGVRIPIIYHLTGTTSVLSPEIVESVDYLPGGYGVHYGRSMGGVIDVTSKRTIEENRLTWGTDVLDSQVFFQGNVGKEGHRHGIAVGARRSYIDAFLPLFIKGQSFTIKPSYWDYQAKWLPPVPGNRHFSAFVYGFNDLLAVTTSADTAQGSDQDTQGDLRTTYTSHRVLLNYEQELGEHVDLEVIPALGIDGNDFGLGNEFRLGSLSTNLELRTELAWKPGPGFELVPGLDLVGGWWRFEFASPFRFSDLDPLDEREAVAFDGRGTAWSPDVYVKGVIRPLDDRDRLLIIPGARLNTTIVTYGGDVGEGVPPWVRTSVDPRLLTRFEIVPGVVLKGSTGLYHQPPQPFESVGLGEAVKLGHEVAWSSSVGIEHEISPVIQWDLELFYKKLDDLVVFDDAWTGWGSDIFANRGSGAAYGLEVIARHQPANGFFGWISYTLSRSIRRDAPGDDWYFFDFDQTHIFSAQAGYDLPADFGLSAQVQYVTGNPQTAYDTAVYDVDADAHNPLRVSAWNGERLPPFFQLSLRVDKLWTFKRWQLETYVDLLNVVRGVNPEFTVYNDHYTEKAYVRGLPFIPNVGIEAKFWP